jgi:hypothetical protein
LVSRIDNRKIATTIGSQYGTVYVAHFDAEIGYRYSSNSSAPHPWAYKSISGYTSNNGLFVWNHRQTSLHISLPHWLIAIVATMIGAGCWLPLHFSLRTLLFFTTLVAAALGLAVYAAR